MSDARENPSNSPNSINRSGYALFDVDDTTMLRLRKIVMNVCIVQIFLSLALLANWRRGPYLLILNPFFIGAGVMGYIGARDCNALLVFGHFCGSAGLSILFMLFMLAEQFVKSSEGSDWIMYAINMPMDLYMLTTAYFSIRLSGALDLLTANLDSHVQNRTQQDLVSLNRQMSMASTHQTHLDLGRLSEEDLICPITRDIFRDPVVASDGHTYEREAIERWFINHRTSPMTGALMPSTTLLSNHKIKSIVQDMSMSYTANSGQSGQAVV